MSFAGVRPYKRRYVCDRAYRPPIIETGGGSSPNASGKETACLSVRQLGCCGYLDPCRNFSSRSCVYRCCEMSRNHQGATMRLPRCAGETPSLTVLWRSG